MTIGEDVEKAPSIESSIRTVPGVSPYADGSVVVEVRDSQFNSMVMMRKFLNGDMIPIDQSYD